MSPGGFSFGRAWIRRALLAGAACLGLATVVAGVRHWPRPRLTAGIPWSVAVHDRESRLLRLTLAADQQYRIWTPLSDIAPAMIEATLIYEDRHFFRHPGVNPFALVRAARRTYAGGGPRVGGSTLTMQLARRLYTIDSSTVGGKLHQIAAALWIELRYPKRAILEAYLNLAPYGGNVQGVGAASLIYFRQTPALLSGGEAATLAVIPQNPTRRGPLTGRIPPPLERARTALLRRWHAHSARNASPLPLALPSQVSAAGALPFLAPHFVDGVLAEDAGLHRPAGPAGPAATRIDTTLDLDLQGLLERHLAAYVARQRRLGIDNGAALLVDHRTRQVRAAVGSADFFDAALAGQVDGTRARRSPGSTLKPFVYALGLEQGAIHPATMLRDAPRAFGPLNPENFDGRFAGPLPAALALTRSRNIPALAVAAALSDPGLYDFLRTAGVYLPRSESHYGLGLALGTGEVTMEELAALYAMLADGGRMRPLEKRLPSAVRDATFAVRLLSEEASFLVLDILEGAARPGPRVFGDALVDHLPVAWKTGTSWGFRDAWTVGVVGPYVLAVWVGNFSGAGNPAFVGGEAAAPLFFEIVDSLVARRGAWSPARRRPANLRHIEVCAVSGGLPTESCTHTRKSWFIPGRSPIDPCVVHRRFALDAQGRRTCPAAGPVVRHAVFEVWPSELGGLFASAGLPRQAVPPAAPGCQDTFPVQGQPLRIASPLRGVTYTLRPGRSGEEAIALEASVDGEVREVFWFADRAFIGRTPGGSTLFWRPDPGRYLVRAVDDQGRSESRPVEVEVLR